MQTRHVSLHLLCLTVYTLSSRHVKQLCETQDLWQCISGSTTAAPSNPFITHAKGNNCEPHANLIFLQQNFPGAAANVIELVKQPREFSTLCQYLNVHRRERHIPRAVETLSYRAYLPCKGNICRKEVVCFTGDRRRERVWSVVSGQWQHGSWSLT